jgi:predicted acyl esterase
MKKVANDRRKVISQPQHAVKAEKDVYVKMRDGVRLAVNVYRPEAAGKFPALLASSPYGKELMEMVRWMPTSARTEPLWDGCLEAGDIDYLYASIDQDDTNWFIRLNDVDPSGKRIALSRGYLKASHRALDQKQSKPWQPYHPHTNPEPIKPGEIYEYAIELMPNANVFKTGHCIELEIRSTESPKDPLYTMSIGGNHLPVGRTVSHKIYHDTKHPSYLLLPIVPGKGGR